MLTDYSDMHTVTVLLSVIITLSFENYINCGMECQKLKLFKKECNYSYSCLNIHEVLAKETTTQNSIALILLA